jgi:PKD repeat protein
MRNGVGTSVEPLTNNTRCGQTDSGTANVSGQYSEHWRGLITFNTVAIPANANITSAIVSVYGRHQLNELGTVNFAIIDANPSSKSAYAMEDYNKTTFIRMAPDISYASFTEDAWNNFTLNPQGRAYITKAGLTTFMVTHSADVDNSPLTWKNNSLSAFEIRGVNYSAGALKPFITINYDLPPVASFTPNVTSGTAPLTVLFNDTSNAVSPLMWNWSFGDGNWSNTTVSGQRNVTYTYTTPSTYTVRLTVANASGSNTTSPGTTITVNAPAFTPDKIGIYQNGVWYLDWNGNGAFDSGVDKVYSFGAPGWMNVTGDWNHDGKTDIGVTNGQQWYLDMNNNGIYDSGVDKSYNFGAPGWTPIVGDWNATGNSYIGVTDGQQWYLDWNGNGVFDSGVDKSYNFGALGWTPIIGDWNATGNSYIGVTNGQQWYLDWNGNGAFDSGVDKSYNFGALGWTPIVGDWDVTGHTYIGVTNGQQWYLDWNGNGAFDSGVDKSYNFGALGWMPIVGDWNATGFKYIGVTNGQQWYLDWNGNGVFDSGVDKSYNFGALGWTSVIGKWS